MTNVLFEEDGAFKAGTVLTDAGTSLQVEHASGRRAKVKAGQVVLRFESPEASHLIEQAQRVADGLELDFLWECAPRDEFGFLDLAGDYFGRTPTAPEATGLLLKLQSAPIYFHRKGKGRYRPAPAETLKAALAAVERRRQQEATIDAHVDAMIAGELPAPIRALAAELVVRPDKQSLEYRALERACGRLQVNPEALLVRLGAFASSRQLHLDKFVVEYFPRGTGFGASASAPQAVDLQALPSADVVAFSIDDTSTTEIDDCLSVSALPDGRWRVGVHIAAPVMAIPFGGALDVIARERMSTVYMPGDKFTMLPPATVAAFSLDAGCERPAVSLYLDLDASGTQVVGRTSRLERLQVAANLRHDDPALVALEERLQSGQPGGHPHEPALAVLWKFAQALTRGREKVRGKPEPRARGDFAFRIDGEQVQITQRRRDAPLDRIVAEMMILVNSEWGRLLAEHEATGIYRSQQAGRVRMSSHPAEHQGLGVAQYAWSTSPLRRYVDLVNQRQLVAVLGGDKPPLAANDGDLFSIVSAFEARYAAYATFQTQMERWWCLRWLEQRGDPRVAAVVIRDDLVRLADAPFYFRLVGLPRLAAGRRILVDVIARDEIALTVQARFVDVAHEQAAGGEDNEAGEAGDAAVDGEDGGFPAEGV